MPNPKPAILIATSLGIAVGIVASVKPWAAWMEQREEAQQVRAELKATSAQRAKLEIDEARSRSEVGRETRARDSGYRAKNERDLTPPPAIEDPVLPTAPPMAAHGTKPKSPDAKAPGVTESPAEPKPDESAEPSRDDPIPTR